MADKVKKVSLESVDSKTQKQQASLSEEDKLITQTDIEYQPNFIKARWEEGNVYNNGYDAWIIIGKDRPGNRSSGYSSDFGAGAIDLVVGRQQMANATPKHHCDPNFKTDAARIYISQKTDIDENFNLCDGKDGKPLSRSGIGIKADAVRVIGREGIKLITTSDSFNSKGAKIKSWAGIDLIAGNDDSDLQPLVKGDNLVKALESLVEYFNGHIETFASFVKSQMKINADQSLFNNAVLSHTHFVQTVGPATIGTATTSGITLASPVIAANSSVLTTIPQEVFNMAADTVISTVNTKTNLVMYKSNVFTPKCFDYILSKNNHTN